MYLQQVTKNVFLELEAALLQVNNKDYSKPIPRLFMATIGQHVRHIIELYQCLIAGYDDGLVNYEKRKRDLHIETDRDFAILLLHGIARSINKNDKMMALEAAFGSDAEVISITTNYKRELIYNLEHTIHHMALIRVGLNEIGSIQLPDSFGVAPSTIQHKKACVQ